ncbi:hypothetical protein [Sphaerisporangium corydalis]|uniref:Uncharacterized protein n=1 Tax=Sphaerisporangium corydalis TaxID=1441875 RepID=A0ABV9ERC8_9ACTN|nr:hypothetical protein [Sphaerisporangium corydalis]
MSPKSNKSLLAELFHAVTKLSSEIKGTPTSPGPVVDMKRDGTAPGKPRRR